MNKQKFNIVVIFWRLNGLYLENFIELKKLPFGDTLQCLRIVMAIRKVSEKLSMELSTNATSHDVPMPEAQVGLMFFPFTAYPNYIKWSEMYENSKHRV